LGQSGRRTLLEQLPEVRSTNDLDLFIRAEVLADLEQTQAVAAAIKRLGYAAVEEAKYMQWARSVEDGWILQEVKIDLLVGPLGELRSRMKIKEPRVRPQGDVQLHAHSVEEALRIDDSAVPVPVVGRRSNGESCQTTVWVPHAFPYLLMKLFAFRD